MKIILVILGIIVVIAIQFICFILSVYLLWLEGTFFGHKKITFKDAIKHLIKYKDAEGYNFGIILYLISPLFLVTSALSVVSLFLFKHYK